MNVVELLRACPGVLKVDEHFDVGLARKLRDHIITDPRSHEQATWGYQHEDCGTVACAAGWLGLLSGRVEVWRHGLLRGFVSPETGEVEHPAVAGQQALGISGAVATALFHGCATHQDTIEYLDALIAESDRRHG